MSASPVTIAILVYRSVPWLKFAIEGLESARNETPWKLLVVGNDAEPDVMASGLVDIDHRNADPSEYYINRVYRAWNRAVAESPTEDVVLMNSDMFVSDHWLDELMAGPDEVLATSLLVESGRLASGMPDFVRDFGRTTKDFDREAWRAHARRLRVQWSGLYHPGGLFMPVRFKKSVFLEHGGYPEGNVGSVSGDEFFFRKLAADGYHHHTFRGSIVYHVQEGEMRTVE